MASDVVAHVKPNSLA